VVELANSLDRQRATFTNNGPMLEGCLYRGLVLVGDAFDPVLFAGTSELRSRIRSHMNGQQQHSDATRQNSCSWTTLRRTSPERCDRDGAIHFESPAKLRQELRAAGISA
jgi:hypothetical protein